MLTVAVIPASEAQSPRRKGKAGRTITCIVSGVMYGVRAVCCIDVDQFNVILATFRYYFIHDVMV